MENMLQKYYWPNIASQIMCFSGCKPDVISWVEENKALGFKQKYFAGLGFGTYPYS